jgi:hypothetical protein
LCCQHNLRNLAGAAETYPEAHWPIQITQALQELIHAANTARARGLPALPDGIAAPLIHAFKHGVLVGLSQIARVPGRKQQPGPRPCSNACATGRTMCCASPLTCGFRRHRTRPNATCAQPEPSRKYRVGSAPSRSPVWLVLDLDGMPGGQDDWCG